jgi:ACR3 family arsenite efflux pump ArsB
VATVALCVIAGGDAAVCATLLAASTIITVVAAGPILSLLGASVTVSSAGLLGNLAVVIALPLAAGVALRTVWSPRPGADAAVRLVTVLALLLLLWQVASQIRLDSAYVQVIVALVVYVAGSAALGGVLALRAPAGQATAILLPVAMRDFAVAAGIAAAAFGPAAAAPLGAYGVLVLLAGSLAAIIARRRPSRSPTQILELLPLSPCPPVSMLAWVDGTLGRQEHDQRHIDPVGGVPRGAGVRGGEASGSAGAEA